MNVDFPWFVAGGEPIRNEKGFILPITMVLCLIMSLALAHLIEIYLLEKKFYYEQEEIYSIESLMQMATTDLMKEVKQESPSSLGELYYENGSAMYWILEESHDTVNIQLKVISTGGRQRSVSLLLDHDQLKVKEWKELSK